MSRHVETLRQLLDQVPASSRQLAENTRLSQPTLSRTLRAMDDDIVRLGAGPSIHYALRDRARGFAAAPIYQVNERGQLQPAGQLIPVRRDGFVTLDSNGGAHYSAGLPYWLFDMRPQGYLGRAYAATHATALGLPANPEHWRDADIVRALLLHGHDNVGNRLIGDRARDHFVAQPAPHPANPASDYPALARAASAGELAGSSAGGEQPKFCAYVQRGHVLVKFSAADANPVSARWRDLLLAEDLALQTLGVDSALFDLAGQRFLEVPRFDRVGEFGRRGVVSLRALDAEYVGDAAAPWPHLVRQLAAQKQVDPTAIANAQHLWAFGTLIGNSDMHAGNLSFIEPASGLRQLAPAYDMLPMAFAPRPSGALVDSLPPAHLTAAVGNDIWRAALTLARHYLARLQGNEGFSAAFAPCIAALAQHIDDAATRIGRLG